MLIRAQQRQHLCRGDHLRLVACQPACMYIYLYMNPYVSSVGRHLRPLNDVDDLDNSPKVQAPISTLPQRRSILLLHKPLPFLYRFCMQCLSISMACFPTFLILETCVCLLAQHLSRILHKVAMIRVYCMLFDFACILF